MSGSCWSRGQSLLILGETGYTLRRSAISCRANTEMNTYLHSHSQLWTIKSSHVTKSVCLCIVGGSRSTWRKPTPHWENMRDSTMKVFSRLAISNPKPYCCEATVLTTAPLHHPVYVTNNNKHYWVSVKYTPKWRKLEGVQYRYLTREWTQEHLNIQNSRKM